MSDNLGVNRLTADARHTLWGRVRAYQMLKDMDMLMATESSDEDRDAADREIESARERAIAAAAFSLQVGNIVQQSSLGLSDTHLDLRSDPTTVGELYDWRDIAERVILRYGSGVWDALRWSIARRDRAARTISDAVLHLLSSHEAEELREASGVDFPRLTAMLLPATAAPPQEIATEDLRGAIIDVAVASEEVMALAMYTVFVIGGVAGVVADVASVDPSILVSPPMRGDA